MAIEKLDFDRVIQSHKGFTTFLNEVIQSIKDHNNLAIYCFLSTLPPDWKVSVQHLMNHFDLGRDKVKKVLKWLNDNKLLTYKEIRNDDGTYQSRSIVILDGFDYLDQLKNNSSTVLKTSTPVSTVLKNQLLDNPASGLSAPTYINNNTEIKKEAYTNKEIEIELPFWLDRNLWEEFKNHRKQIKKPLNKSAEMKAIEKLVKFHNEGQNVQNIINESIINGWSGLFPVKKQYGNNKSNESSLERFSRVTGKQYVKSRTLKEIN